MANSQTIPTTQRVTAGGANRGILVKGTTRISQRSAGEGGSSDTSGHESVVRLIAGSVTITSLRWEGDDDESIEDAEHLIYGHTKLKFQDQEGELAGEEDGNDLVLGHTTLVTQSGYDEYLDASLDELVDETSELAVTPTKDEGEDNRKRHRIGSSRKHEVQGVSTKPKGQRRRANDELGRERRNLYVPEWPKSRVGLMKPGEFEKEREEGLRNFHRAAYVVKGKNEIGGDNEGEEEEGWEEEEISDEDSGKEGESSKRTWVRWRDLYPPSVIESSRRQYEPIVYGSKW